MIRARTLISALAALVALPAMVALPAVAQAPAGPPKLAFPMACEIGKTCEIQHYFDRDPGPAHKDYRCARQTYQAHGGVDFRILDMAAQRRGVDVLAAAPGKVTRLRDGVADISVKAPGAPPVSNMECGNGVVVDHGGGWETHYCHMAKGSLKVKVGDEVRAGTPVGRVGLSGNTEFPHMHLRVQKGSEEIDPFAPARSTASCQAAAPLWTPAAMAAMPYKRGAVLNSGFASGQLTMQAIEDGNIPAPTRTSPFLVGYVRAIGLEAGDRLELEVRSPDGAVMARQANDPLPRDQAQYFTLVGRKRPPEGFAPGRYLASFKVYRDGKVAISRQFELRL